MISRIFCIAVGALFLFSAICEADTISVYLTPPILSAPQASVLSFSGTLLNTTSSTVFLNSAGINLSAPFAPTDEDTSGFFTNAPLLLSGGGMTSNIGLFAINIAPSYPGGLYVGTFTVLGGADGDAQDILGFAKFHRPGERKYLCCTRAKFKNPNGDKWPHTACICIREAQCIPGTVDVIAITD